MIIGFDTENVVIEKPVEDYLYFFFDREDLDSDFIKMWSFEENWKLNFFQIAKNMGLIKENEYYTEEKIRKIFLHPANKFMGYNTLLNGVSFLGFSAFGDWEVPIYGLIY